MSGSQDMSPIDDGPGTPVLGPTVPLGLGVRDGDLPRVSVGSGASPVDDKVLLCQGGRFAALTF